MNSDSPIVFLVDDDFRVREALSSLISSARPRNSWNPKSQMLPHV